MLVLERGEVSIRHYWDLSFNHVEERPEAEWVELLREKLLECVRAQMISDVLAAPDLIRFPLVGRDSLESATGQVLWSRSRGIFVFSASGLPAPAHDSTYQVWLLTRTGAVSVATFDPDSGGRATVTATPKVPPLVGAMVTMERKGGNDTPSGEPLLTRAPLVSSGA